MSETLTAGDFVQTSNLIILRNWKSGSETSIRVKKRIRAFRDPDESIRLNSTFWFDDFPTNGCYTCNYDVSLGFGTNVLSGCRYEISFYLETQNDKAAGATKMETLLECGKVRTGNTMQFSGKFATLDDFLLNYACYFSPVSSYKLYVEVKRFRWQLAAPISAGVVATGGKIQSEKIDVHHLESKLQQGLERQIEVMRVSAEKYKKLQDLLLKKIEKLEKSQVANGEVVKLKAIEHNLLVQLQHTEQKAHAQTQELKGKIKQLELSAKSLEVQHKIQIDEMLDQLQCCVCYANRVDIVWIPCGHARFCSKCVSSNRARGVQPDECMICRQSGRSYKLIL